MAWTQYMQLVIERLNALTAGTEFEEQDPLSIIKATAREPSLAPIFNYASMAHNNHFFFKNLANKKSPSHQQPGEDADENEATSRATKMSETLKKLLARQFSSIETLRREFYATAMGMFGPGFVWLVKNGRSSDMRILVTYLAGTPYTAGHWRRQGVDMNTHGLSSPDTVQAWLDRTKAGAGADTGGRFLQQSQTAPGGTDVIPLLCLNTWEHVWLRDYGIGAGGVGGKRQYIMNWWNTIDWAMIEDEARIGIAGPSLKI